MVDSKFLNKFNVFLSKRLGASYSQAQQVRAKNRSVPRAFRSDLWLGLIISKLNVIFDPRVMGLVVGHDTAGFVNVIACRLRRQHHLFIVAFAASVARHHV